MSGLSALICQYCAHRNDGEQARCAHCGAPLREVAHGVERVLEAGAREGARLAEQPGGPAGLLGAGMAAAAGFPAWQWRAAGAGILIMIVLGVFAARSCVPQLPEMPRPTAEQALPELLRSVSSCQPVAAVGGAETCVISAGHPLLFGLTGGRELTFSAELTERDRLSEDISRWRAAGGAALVDGPVYAAVGPSATVWYADTRAGLRLETGTFTGRVAAQTFLSRAGLAR